MTFPTKWKKSKWNRTGTFTTFRVCIFLMLLRRNNNSYFITLKTLLFRWNFTIRMWAQSSRLDLQNFFFILNSTNLAAGFFFKNFIFARIEQRIEKQRFFWMNDHLLIVLKIFEHRFHLEGHDGVGMTEVSMPILLLGLNFKRHRYQFLISKYVTPGIYYLY